MTQTGTIIQDVIFDLFDIERKDIRLETTIESLFDVTDKLFLFLELEVYFDVDIEPEKWDDIKTIQELIAIINERKTKQTII